jgi:hypothetical protein
VRKWAEGEGVQAHFIHCGDHAWPQDLKRLADAIHPGVLEIVHTAKS